MSSDLLLSARGITKTYPGRKHPLATFMYALLGESPQSVDGISVLKGIDLEIRKGETVGIMGRNGAGKTTLLGILGGVIEPSDGRVFRHGRIATLLGLTAGFNANFSGRENAYLFCSIQGLTRKQADERVGKILEFSELGRFFDMPIRTYSSGMQARLAFSCAIQVDAELIIVDETLAVGDANFKMKCYEHINEMRREGQTFLLVSHSQNLIASFCSRAIVLEAGQKMFDGPVLEGVDAYKQIRLEQQSVRATQLESGKKKGTALLGEDVSFNEFQFEEAILDADSRMGIIVATLTAKRTVTRPYMNFGIRTHEGIVIASYDGKTATPLPDMVAGKEHKYRMRFENRLMPGRYFLSAAFFEQKGDVAIPLAFQNSLAIDVLGERTSGGFVKLNMSVETDASVH